MGMASLLPRLTLGLVLGATLAGALTACSTASNDQPALANRSAQVTVLTPTRTNRLTAGNTDGDGVWLRASPGYAGDKIKAWPEGTVFEVAGPDREVEGVLWKNVRDPEGRVGWVFAAYLLGSDTTSAPTVWQVANTGGSGAWLYGLPSSTAPVRQWPDGTLLEVVGRDLFAEGRSWKKMRDPSGNEGWVLADVLVPASVTPTPTATASPTPSPTPTHTASATPTATPTRLPTDTPTPVPTATPASTPSQEPSVATSQPPPAAVPENGTQASPVVTPVSATSPLATPGPVASPSAPSRALELLSVETSTGFHFTIVAGTVRNRTGGDLLLVSAEVQALSGNGNVLARASAPLRDSPLGQDQTSEFVCVLESDYQPKDFAISFRDAYGTAIPLRDLRQR